MFEDVKKLWEKLCCIVKRLNILENQVNNTPPFTCTDLSGCSLDALGTKVTTLDSATVDFSGDGSTTNPLTGSLKISTTCLNNILTAQADGLCATQVITNLVDNGDGTATYTNELGVPSIFNSNPTLVDNGDGTSTLTLLDGNTVVIITTPTVVFDDQVLTASDTDTINVTLTPSAPSGADSQVDYTMSADLKIDNVAPGNVTLTTTANGLVANAPVAPDYIQSISDTNTVDLDVTADDLTANIKYQDSDTIDLSEDINGLKADLRIDTVTPGNVTITEGINGVVANYTQLPVVTLCEIEGNGTTGNEIKLKNSFYKDGLFVTFFPTVTGGFIPSSTTPTKQFKELSIFKDGCQPGIYLDLPSADCDSVVYKSDVLDAGLERVKPLENVEFYDLNNIATTPQLDKNYIHLIDTSVGAYSLVLPVPTLCQTNVIKVKKMSSDSNDITVTGAGGELVDDLAAWNKSVLSPATIWSQYECYVFTFNRLTNKWYVNS